MKKLIPAVELDRVMASFFWLAWQACGGPTGMGVLQNFSGATKEHVFANVQNSGDYAMRHERPGQIYADYVFGRMMKVGVEFKRVTDAYVEIGVPDRPPRHDYQAWCGKYATYDALLTAALEDAKVTPLGEAEAQAAQTAAANKPEDKPA